MQTQIENLQQELKTTKENLNNTNNELNNTKQELSTLQKNAITNIQGVQNEISVTVTDNTATVGFADDAYFVAG